VQPLPYERRVVVPQKEPVELLKLAALSFPSHPLAFAVIPAPFAMEQEESGARVESDMTCVEPRDAFGRGREKSFIGRRALGRRIHPVREKSKVDGAIRIGEIVELETIDLLLDLVAAHEQSRHHHD